MTKQAVAGWLALALALALAIGGGAITQDLTTLIGADAAEKVVATARILSALIAAATGAVIAKRGKA